MKNMLSQLFMGVIGGLVVLVGIQLFSPDPAAVDQQSKAVNVNYSPTDKPVTVKVPFDFVEASRRTTQSVVHITAKKEASLTNQSQQASPFDFFFRDGGNPFGNNGPQQGTGSGVIISKDGYIVTNNHVVEFADHVEVTLLDKKTYIAEVVGTYPKADLAVLKIDSDELPVLDWADSDNAQVGEWVLAVGNPLELNSTVTAGIISAKSRSIDILRSKGNDAIESFIQTDAVVNPGNSGGALVNSDGELLGINTAIKSGTGYYAGYSFAIPSNIVKNIVNDIIDYGSYQRAFLGVEIAEIDQELAAKYKLEVNNGIYIADLVDGGSAQYSGLLPGDVILMIGDKSTNTVPEIQESVSRLKVGDTVTLKILRDGTEENIEVRMRAAKL